MTEQIEHVSDTAFWVAWHRAQEGLRKDALFRDPLAAKLVGKRGAKLARHMGIKRAMTWSMALRTHILDQYILEAIKGGVDAVINLGAGLDTRPYRLDLPKNLPWIEVDFEHMIAHKNDVLHDEQPACRLQRIACDLSDDPARQTLLHTLNDAGRNILVLTEGVIPYLSNEAVASLAHELHEQDHVSYWLTDYYSAFFRSLSARGKIMKQLAKHAPFRFNPGDAPADWPRFFAEQGWQIDDIRYVGEEGGKLGRNLPANWLIWQLMRRMPESRLRPYLRMNGLIRLVRGTHIFDMDA
ncbi:SAM-dependent methyltransferase [Asticcacaulis sp. EMRT-3]|uniref:class I SAM-dependent methyltransferase n=1 Tax=Asticcacaulis sp. EMRT-3 TaxID=3040349 RepID=UPI0024AF93EC|nr:SAM-dependent methyltransferase [Asticcacaulis sp. EMRT-3]MDI7774493.1 SAM-dependent methyltransferase [Asticcacaulis sp. EMRT-3]